MKEQLTTVFKWEFELVTFETGQTAYLAWVVKEAEFMETQMRLRGAGDSKFCGLEHVPVKSTRVTRHGVQKGISGYFALILQEKMGEKFKTLDEAKAAAKAACERAEKRFRENNIISREVVL